VDCTVTSALPYFRKTTCHQLDLRLSRDKSKKWSGQSGLAAPGAMSKEKTNKILVPVILAFVAFGFYVLSIVMQFLSAGAGT